MVSAYVGILECNATLLNLNPELPDFMAGFMNVSYNSGSGLFQASGFTLDYQGGSATLIDFGEYTLTATITSAGVLTSGSLLIRETLI